MKPMRQSQVSTQNLSFHRLLTLTYSISFPPLNFHHPHTTSPHLTSTKTLTPNNPKSPTAMASSALFSAPSFQGLRPLNKATDSSSRPAASASASASFRRAAPKRSAVRAELNPSLVISLSTGLSLFLGRFVFFNFQRENVAKQVPEQNGISHFEAGDLRAKEYVSLLKSNDPVGFNIVDVLAWGSIGHIVAYYILATSSNGYDPSFFG